MARCDFKFCPDCGAQLDSLGPSDATACSVVRWISVSDKLPDDDMTVLIADTENDVTLGFHDWDFGWRYCSAGIVGDPVTHWAEIPDPPNKELSNL